MKLELFADFELDLVVDKCDWVLKGVELSILVFFKLMIGGDGNFFIGESDADGGIGCDMDLFGIENDLHVLHLGFSSE